MEPEYCSGIGWYSLKFQCLRLGETPDQRSTTVFYTVRRSPLTNKNIRSVLVLIGGSPKRPQVHRFRSDCALINSTLSTRPYRLFKLNTNNGLLR